MDDPSDDLRVGKPRRIEILTDGGAPRRWPESTKAKIVAESLEPGVVVTELARRYGARASQIHLWRKDAREGRLVLPAPPAAFAEVMIAPPLSERTQREARAASIEIDASTIAIRVRAGADPEIITAIIRALKS